jgi:hypothetical protein
VVMVNGSSKNSKHSKNSSSCALFVNLERCTVVRQCGRATFVQHHQCEGRMTQSCTGLKFCENMSVCMVSKTAGFGNKATEPIWTDRARRFTHPTRPPHGFGRV